MTDEEINTEIAKACNVCFERRTVCPWCNGNTPYEAGDDYGITIWAKCKNCSNTGKVEPYYAGIPDYCNNLNVMHKAEKLMTNAQKKSYVIELNQAHETADIFYPSQDQHGFKDELAQEVFDLLHATARQRAEAFLRTLNLCKE